MLVAVISGYVILTAKASTALPADVNSDGKVDVFDLSLLLAGWDKIGSTDVNSDGKTDIFDLSLVLANWGKTAPGSTPAPSITSTPVATATGTPAANPLSSLPLISWDGGPAYWNQFPKAKAAGWNKDTFIPVGIWWSGVGDASQVAFDKNLGANFYTLMNADTDFNLIQDGGMYWVGGSGLKNLQENSPNWVGTFLDDEVDGRYEPAAGFTYLQGLSDAANPAVTGRFRYTNYSAGVLTYDRPDSVQNQYVNTYTDAISTDAYKYSTASCGWDIDHYWRYSTPNPQDKCRSAHSYGLFIDMMKRVDAMDGKLQPIWSFVENMSPDGNVGGAVDISPSQIKGAVMSSFIHGAMGMIWFNQSFQGNCTSGNVFRTAQQNPTGCAAANTQAAKEVGQQIKAWAPIINTQSYQYSFGAGLDTMLKWYKGSAYIFAMTDGYSGSRTFTLPPGIANAASVTVVDDGRVLPVGGGKFTDNFPAEYVYHLYKITP